MSTRSRILVLFDNNGKEYVSRIQSGVAKFGGSTSFKVDGHNIFGTDTTIAGLLDDQSLAGVILTPPLTDDRHVLLQVEQRKLPYVRIAPMLDLDRGNTVVMDEYDAARSITDLLLQKGHRRIAFLRGPKVHLFSMRRYNGYTAAMGTKGGRVDPSWMAEGDFSRQSGRDQAAKLFAAKPTAIFASNDEMAAGVIDAAASAKIAVPEQMSVVGFDDNAVAKSTRPMLTTVRQPLEEMGEKACDLLLECIRNPTRTSGHVEVPFQIVERASVAECSNGV